MVCKNKSFQVNMDNVGASPKGSRLSLCVKEAQQESPNPKGFNQYETCFKKKNLKLRILFLLLVAEIFAFKKKKIVTWYTKTISQEYYIVSFIILFIIFFSNNVLCFLDFAWFHAKENYLTRPSILLHA